MYQPQTYATVLFCMLLSMLCWGSWANTRKLTLGYAFSLFYWDCVGGILLGSLLWGLTLGSLGGSPEAFLHDLASADASHWLLAMLGGIIFNAANLLLVAAIDIAGMAVAFPVGIGLALIVGTVLNYFVSPAGSPLLIFGGVFLVAVAIVLDAVAYRRREHATSASRRGVVLSIVSGLLMGVFYPFVARATQGTSALGPYAVAFVFALGVLACSLPLNAWFMRRPLTGEAPSRFSEYAAAPPAWHFWGLVGGLVWCTGAVASFVASRSTMVGPAIAYALGQGATMVSAVWGVFVWKEFAGAPASAKRLLPWMFLCFVCGLIAVALAPLYTHF